MTELSNDLLLGLLLSIPIGIVVNLVSPYITRRIDRRSRRSAEKRAVKDVAFKAEATRLATNRPALYTYLLESLIRIAYITAVFGLFAGAFFLLGQLLPYSGLISQGLFASGQLTALIGTVIVLNIARQAVLLLRAVRRA